MFVLLKTPSTTGCFKYMNTVKYVSHETLHIHQ